MGWRCASLRGGGDEGHSKRMVSWYQGNAMGSIFPFFLSPPFSFPRRLYFNLRKRSLHIGRRKNLQAQTCEYADITQTLQGGKNYKGTCEIDGGVAKLGSAPRKTKGVGDLPVLLSVREQFLFLKEPSPRGKKKEKTCTRQRPWRLRIQKEINEALRGTVSHALWEKTKRNIPFSSCPRSLLGNWRASAACTSPLPNEFQLMQRPLDLNQK